MTKKEMAHVIAEKTGVEKRRVMTVIQAVLDGIIEVLATEGRIELRNFGVFEVHKRKARQGRNPRTGEAVAVPEKMAVSFKPGLEMAARIQKVQEMLSCPS